VRGEVDLAAELANRERARRTGGRVLSDQTLLIHLDVVADFARAMPRLSDWATVAQSDIEAFLARSSPAGSHILPSLHAFFGWARRQRLILVDPTGQVRHKLRRRFSGPVVDMATQRHLFKRWTTEPGVHPNEALIGLLEPARPVVASEALGGVLSSTGPGPSLTASGGRSTRGACSSRRSPCRP
jgi:hypothetical protein